MNAEWQEVREFHEKFGHPVSDVPVQLTTERAGKRYKWMLEELDEFLEANRLVDQADAMLDLIYFALGTLVEMGLPPDALFQVVHQANMSKLWPDGKPHYNEDGKTIKPSTWQAPEAILESLIAAQKEQ